MLNDYDYRFIGKVKFVYILPQIAARETHMVNLKQSVSVSRNNEFELRAKMTEARSNLDKKTREMKSMESRWVRNFDRKMSILIFISFNDIYSGGSKI